MLKAKYTLEQKYFYLNQETIKPIYHSLLISF